jgi:valyl-tRNA synthetase
MYLIDVPPPTISGLLHMGHVFSYCHMDFIARYQGKKQALLYPSCFDCNGLPTEKLAQKAGVREPKEIIAFAEKTWGDYQKLFAATKMSWSNHHFHSYDDDAVTLANLSFEDLKRKGLAYKAEREFYYCPVTKVSVSQAEIDENGCYERSGAKVELRMGEGWFIDILNHLPRIREAIDKINWKPDTFRERLHSWLDGLKFDWSISRERNYGIHIPGEADNIVFDTWFTSSLSPQMAWAKENGHPTLLTPIFDARFQAHDIIRTWALFTIIKSLYHNDQIPWNNIIVSGHALDKNGKKISKTANNFVDPYTYLEKHGAYGVRYWSALNQVGTDTRSDVQVMDKGRKLINKIKNAGRFLDMKESSEYLPDILDEWTKEWYEVAKKFDNCMQEYNWPDAIHILTDFFWHRFCDVFIEESKKKEDGFTYGVMKRIYGQILDCYDIFFPNIREEIK